MRARQRRRPSSDDGRRTASSKRRPGRRPCRGVRRTRRTPGLRPGADRRARDVVGLRRRGERRQAQCHLQRDVWTFTDVAGDLCTTERGCSSGGATSGEVYQSLYLRPGEVCPTPARTARAEHGDVEGAAASTSPVIPKALRPTSGGRVLRDEHDRVGEAARGYAGRPSYGFVEPRLAPVRRRPRPGRWPRCHPRRPDSSRRPAAPRRRSSSLTSSGAKVPDPVHVCVALSQASPRLG